MVADIHLTKLTKDWQDCPEGFTRKVGEKLMLKLLVVQPEALQDFAAAAESLPPTQAPVSVARGLKS